MQFHKSGLKNFGMPIILRAFEAKKSALNSWNERDAVCLLPTVFWLPILEGH